MDAASPGTWITKVADPIRPEVHWLQDEDMLPHDIPNARIFTYDWNANTYQDAEIDNIAGHSKNLLNDLKAARSDVGHFFSTLHTKLVEQ